VADETIEDRKKTPMNLTSTNSPRKTSHTPRSLKVELLVLALIFVVGFSSRFLLDDLPNFKPVAALALFGGFYFQRSTLAVLGLVAILMVSDFFLGSYPLAIALSVYASLGLGVWLGRRFKGSESSNHFTRYGGVAAASLVMAVVFFILTNLAVWGAWYPATFEGLVACYVSAIPFFKYTLAGNLFFSVAAFGTYDLVRAMLAKRTPAAVPSAAVQTS